MRVSARKVVTVLFCDIVGFTALSGELDPESLRQLMSRYFETMKVVLQHHGGTIEKYIGDAIMAIFGVPRVHEDDAVRAVRAAAEMRQALQQLNEEFERNWGVTIDTRTGVNTGEVVTSQAGLGDSFVTADAVNVAARLEQHADPGQILMGDATYRLVSNAVDARAVPPLTVKGKADPLPAWQLLNVTTTAPGWGRRLDSPLMGRKDELAALEGTLQQVVREQTCVMVTLVGGAGVGKSRLGNEFISVASDRARVVIGHCFPYGEGITFWPVIEVLRGVAGIDEQDSAETARSKVSTLVERRGDADLITQRLAALLRLTDTTTSMEETFWAVRKVFEELAGNRPLVVVFDDIHTGEPTFLDLIEYLVDWIRDVPLMILCLARHELFELRGAWMPGKANASLLHLQPLTQPDIAGLMQNLLGGAELAEEANSTITDIAEGNPLFIEETLRMLIDNGTLQHRDERWILSKPLSDVTIPPTIHAVLAARLDRLEEEERAVLERASVVGRTFWWGAVSELTGENQRPRVGNHLQSLVRRELIRPDHAERWEEDAFRFMHILIRDAAYGGIPKATRAELHQRFAQWIETNNPRGAGDYEEVVGFHLEQAYLALAQLGPTGARTQALAGRAAVPLSSAGRRAFDRGDMPAAVNLLSRAVALYRHDDRARIELLPDLAFALLETGEFTRLRAVVDQTVQAARSSNEPGLQAQALLLRLWAGVSTDPEGWAQEGLQEAQQAISLFEAEGDERGLAKSWSLLGLVQLYTCRFSSSEEAWEKAAAYAHAAGSQREELEYLSWVPLVVWGGPTRVDKAINRCNEILQRTSDDRKTMSTALFVQGKLEAMRGRFDEGRDLVARARAVLEEVASPVWMAGPLTQMAGWIELLAGDPAAAERYLKWGMETLTDIGELSWLSTVEAILAEALYAQGRFDEAEAFLRMSEANAGSEDVYSQTLLHSIGAKALVQKGSTEDARGLGQRAVAEAAGTDSPFLQALALTSLGKVLLLDGSPDEARDNLLEAVTVCERKGFATGAMAARRLLVEANR